MSRHYKRGEHFHNHSDLKEWDDMPLKRKWLNLKESNPHMVILCKIGKFYELFHQDADVFTELTDAPYMKGKIAHTGFPATRVDDFVEKLEANGYDEIGILYPN